MAPILITCCAGKDYDARDRNPGGRQALLLEHIHTHEQLEALLLMHADPTRDWNVQQLADTLKIASSSTAGSLASGSLYLDVD